MVGGRVGGVAGLWAGMGEVALGYGSRGRVGVVVGGGQGWW